MSLGESASAVKREGTSAKCDGPASFPRARQALHYSHSAPQALPAHGAAGRPGKQRRKCKKPRSPKKNAGFLYSCMVPGAGIEPSYGEGGAVARSTDKNTDKVLS